MKKRALTPTEENERERRIEVIRTRVREGKPDPNHVAPVDPYDLAESTRDSLKGANEKPEVWRQVMERHGFVWFEPQILDRTIGPQKYVPSVLAGLHDGRGLPVHTEGLYLERPHREGQWRRVRPFPMAYTTTDLCALFGTPESFDSWIRETEAKRRLARLGIAVTK